MILNKNFWSISEKIVYLRKFRIKLNFLNRKFYILIQNEYINMNRNLIFKFAKFESQIL